MDSFGKTRVIGNWLPSKLNYKTIWAEFPSVIKNILGQIDCKYYTVRSPTQHDDWGGTTRWHQDGDLPIDIVMWSNIYPTWVKNIETEEHLVRKRGDIILVSNVESLHRTPPLPKKHNRWFARLYDVYISSDFNPAVWKASI